jgi:hypothetical protein
MQIETQDDRRIVIAVRALALKLITDRLENGRLIAAWLDAKGEPIRVLEPGVC